MPNCDFVVSKSSFFSLLLVFDSSYKRGFSKDFSFAKKYLYAFYILLYQIIPFTEKKSTLVTYFGPK